MMILFLDFYLHSILKKILTDEGRRAKTFLLNFLDLREVSSHHPDEWATTKQACRDELVVYLSFSSIYILRSTSMY